MTQRFSPFQRHRRGLTLVETMIALSIFTVLAAGLSASIILSRKLAEANVYESTALTVATGYLEQLKNIPFGDTEDPLNGTLMAAIQSGTGAKLDTKKDQGTDDPIYLGVATTRPVLIDRREHEDGSLRSELWMDFTVQPEMRYLEPLNGLQAIEITIHYTWRTPANQVLTQRTIKTVRSNVPTF